MLGSTRPALRTLIVAAVLAAPAIFVGVSTVASAAPQGTTYYVSPGGDDDNDGRSADSPLGTLNHAAGRTNPGDTVCIMDGVHQAGGGNGGSLLTITRSGTAGAPITYRSCDDGNSVLPVLKVSQDANSWNVVETARGVSHIVIEKLQIEGDNRSISLAAAQEAKNRADPAFNTNGVFMRQGSTHVTVRDNLVQYLPGCGICGMDVDYVTIESNVVHSTSWFTRYASSGISILGGVNSDANTGHKILIRNNVVYNNRTQVEWEAIKKLSDGNGIIVDSMRNKNDASKTYRGRTLVSDNVVYGNGGSGIHCYYSNNVDIVHNTAYDNSTVLDYGSIFANNCEDSRVINNVNYVRDGRNANLDNNPRTAHSHNLYFNGQAPSARGSQDIQADPLFVNAAGGDFRLGDGSPAKGSALADVVPAVLYGGPTSLDRGARTGLTGTPAVPPAATATAPAATPAAGGTPVPGTSPVTAPARSATTQGPSPTSAAAPTPTVSPATVPPLGSTAGPAPGASSTAPSAAVVAAANVRGGGGLAFTGSDAASLLLAAAVLLGLGVTAVAVGARRPARLGARHFKA